jgi:hypothetical protein
MSYRILSLDGGGAWALIEAVALGAIYGRDTPGHEILADFDLVAANSGGGLVLGGLVENLSPAEIEGYFRDEAKRGAIFAPTPHLGDRALHALIGVGPKYSAPAKLRALGDLMPARGVLLLPLAAAGIRGAGGADVRLLLTAFDYDRNRATFFRSAATHRVGWGDGAEAGVTLAEAIHASTNAPVDYFDEPAHFPYRPGRYWDGGIAGCNNPIVAAITEALVLGRSPDDIVALTLGTGTIALPWPGPSEVGSPLVQTPQRPGEVQDLKKLSTAILDDPPDIATFLAYVMTGGGAGADGRGGRIVRLSPLVSPVRTPLGWEAPPDLGLDDFLALKALGMDAVEQGQVDLIGRLALLWIEDEVRNQPIRMHGDTLEPEIGFSAFRAGAAEWANLRRAKATP